MTSVSGRAWAAFFPMNYTKWLCWQKTCELPFEVRWVYAVSCDLYFRMKKMPSLRRVRKVTGVRHAVARRCLARLTEEGLLHKGVPQHQPGTFYEKGNFTQERWWKGLHYRKVEPTGLGKRADVIYAFVVRANAKRKSIGPSYLMACTGMPKRTVNHAIDRLIRANKLKRDGMTLMALVEEKGVSMTVADHNLNQIKLMLEGCHDRDVRKQLAMVGLTDYPLLFKTFQKFQAAVGGGRIAHQHLLNSIKKSHPELVPVCEKALAAA